MVSSKQLKEIAFQLDFKKRQIQNLNNMVGVMKRTESEHFQNAGQKCYKKDYFSEDIVNKD